jgi:hypothetical protein
MQGGRLQGSLRKNNLLGNTDYVVLIECIWAVTKNADLT